MYVRNVTVFSNVVDIIFSLYGIGLIDLLKTWGVGAIGPPTPLLWHLCNSVY